MPNPDNTAARTVQQARDAGRPFVVASGIESRIYHQGGCNYLSIPSGYPCSCGVDAECNRLAHAFSDALDKFGRDCGE